MFYAPYQHKNPFLAAIQAAWTELSSKDAITFYEQTAVQHTLFVIADTITLCLAAIELGRQASYLMDEWMVSTRWISSASERLFRFKRQNLYPIPSPSKTENRGLVTTPNALPGKAWNIPALPQVTSNRTLVTPAPIQGNRVLVTPCLQSYEWGEIADIECLGLLVEPSETDFESADLTSSPAVFDGVAQAVTFPLPQSAEKHDGYGFETVNQDATQEPELTFEGLKTAFDVKPEDDEDENHMFERSNLRWDLEKLAQETNWKRLSLAGCREIALQLDLDWEELKKEHVQFSKKAKACVPSRMRIIAALRREIGDRLFELDNSASRG